MELRVKKGVGSYNLLDPKEKSFEFTLAIYIDGNIVEENGIKALLQYSGEEEDRYDFENIYGDMGYIFSKCWEYSNRVYSTTNYKAQCILFAKKYKEYFEQLDETILKKKQEEAKKEIAELQKVLDSVTILPEIDSEVNFSINSEIKKLESLIKSGNTSLSELKEGTDSYNKFIKNIANCEAKIEYFKSQLIT